MRRFIRLLIRLFVWSVIYPSLICLSQQDQFYLRYYHLPIKENVNAIKSFSNSNIYAAAKNLYWFDGIEWKVISQKDDKNELTSIVGKTYKEIYFVTQEYPLNYSQLFFFDGKKNKKINHPFGNEIVCMDIDKEGTLWLGGDREIAKGIKNVWRFIEYPPTQLSIQKICAINSNQVWVRTLDGKLFLFDGAKWIRFLEKDNVKKIIIIDNDNILVLTDNKLFEINNQQVKLITESDSLKEITLLDAKASNSIYFAGNNGLFIHYDGKEWKKIELACKENISSIATTGINEGFLACEGGIIIYFSTNPKMINNFINYGFHATKSIQYAKNIDDEYGVGIADFDMNGFQDIYCVCLYDPNRLYLNLNNSPKDKGNNIIERAIERKISGTEESTIKGKNISKIQLGISIADIENDGDEDIYITSLIGNNKLFLNDGHGFFREVSNQDGRAIGSGDRTNSICFSDVNNDGWSDIFLINEFSTNRLFINKGYGYFREVTAESGIESTGGSNGATFGDIDNDGLQDLFVCNWGKPNELYKNISTVDKIIFIKIPFPASNNNSQTLKSNGAIFFDYNNNGLLDIFVTNRGFSNRLYKNMGNAEFKDVTEETIGTDSLLSYSTSAADFDNDGYQDLFVSCLGKSILYKNINGEKFIDVTDLYGVQTEGYCTGSATADIDNDGDMDIYSACFVNGSSKLFINKTDNRNYFILNVEGTISNRDAIGAKVFLFDQLNNKLEGFREINGGSGYSSINSKQVHVGAAGDKVYTIVIYFPASKRTVTLKNLKPGQIINISEEEGFARTKTIIEKRLNAWIKDPELQIEGIKVFSVLILLALSFYKAQRKYEWTITRNLLVHSFLLILFVTVMIAFRYSGMLLSFGLPFGMNVLGIILSHLIYERIIHAKIIKEERKKTRDGIARDLHDDLASTISSGLIYADALKRTMNDGDNKQKNLVQNISSLMVEASETINTLVWTVSPTHDSIQDLAARLRFFVSNTCENNNIISKISVNLGAPDKVLDDEVRKNIFLIFKEAMQNIIKHSYASEVKFTINQSDDDFEITIADNGIGFELQHEKTSGIYHGNGLGNLKKRGKEINAFVLINSSPGNGSEIKVKMKMI